MALTDGHQGGWNVLSVAGRPAVAVLLFVLAMPLAGSADTLEDAIRQIEVLSRTASWTESQARIDAIRDRLDQASPAQRTRIDLIEARNRALDGQIQDSIDQLNAALSRDLGPELRLRAHSLMANITAVDGRYEAAFRHLRAGLDLLPRVDEPRYRGDIFGHAAWLHARLGQSDLAHGYAEQAVAAAEETGDRREVCVELQRLAVAERAIAPLPEREQTLQRALAVCEVAGDPVYRMAVEQMWGELLLEQGQNGQAIEWIERALARARSAGYRIGVLDARVALAKAHLARSAFDQAENVFEPVLADGELAILDAGRQADAWMLKADIAEAAGRPGEAVAALRHAIEARRVHHEQERNLRQAFVQAGFRTDVHERQLALLREQARVAELEETTQRQRRRFLWLGYIATALVSLLLFVMLMRSSRERRHFRRMSQRDSLTGLLNHSHFFELAGNHLAQCRSRGEPFALVLADIDYFKQFNDRHGHAAGDGALRKVSSLLQEVFGASLVGRIGGEEFAMALPGCDRDAACERIERFRERLAPLSHEGRLLEITLSYGLVQADAETDIEGLRQIADEALYQAKHAGRDRLVDAEDRVRPA